jgi:hypothetical protein
MRGGARARACLQEPTVWVFNEFNNVAAVSIYSIFKDQMYAYNCDLILCITQG